MKLIPKVLVASLVIATSIDGIAAAAEPAYDIEARIVAVAKPASGGVVVESDSGGKTVLGGGPGVMTTLLGGVREIRAGADRVRFGATGELELGSQRTIRLVASPRVMTEAGSEASIRTGSSIEYLRPAGDGHYEVATVDDGPGLRLDLTPRPSEHGIAIDWSLQVAVLTGRQPLDGVALDVGRPVLSTSESTAKAVVAPDQWMLLSGHELGHDGGADLLLLLLRVRKVETPAR